MMKILAMAVLLAGCGVGADDPTDESQTQSTGEHQEAVTTYNGYCQAIIIGSRWKVDGKCIANAPQCVAESGYSNPSCPLAWTTNHSYTGCMVPGGSIDTTRPCSFTQ